MLLVVGAILLLQQMNERFVGNDVDINFDLSGYEEDMAHVETMDETTASSVYTLADGGLGDWFGGLMYSVGQQANAVVQLSVFPKKSVDGESDTSDALVKLWTCIVSSHDVLDQWKQNQKLKPDLNSRPNGPMRSMGPFISYTKMPFTNS